MQWGTGRGLLILCRLSYDSLFVLKVLLNTNKPTILCRICVLVIKVAGNYESRLLCVVYCMGSIVYFSDAVD